MTFLPRRGVLLGISDSCSSWGNLYRNFNCHFSILRWKSCFCQNFYRLALVFSNTLRETECMIKAGPCVSDSDGTRRKQVFIWVRLLSIQLRAFRYCLLSLSPSTKFLSVSITLLMHVLGNVLFLCFVNITWGNMVKTEWICL